MKPPVLPPPYKALLLPTFPKGGSPTPAGQGQGSSGGAGPPLRPVRARNTPESPAHVPDTPPSSRAPMCFLPPPRKAFGTKTPTDVPAATCGTSTAGAHAAARPETRSRRRRGGRRDEQPVLRCSPADPRSPSPAQGGTRGRGGWCPRAPRAALPSGPPRASGPDWGPATAERLPAAAQPETPGASAGLVGPAPAPAHCARPAPAPAPRACAVLPAAPQRPRAYGGP